jgi:hypothetical protein
VAPDDRHKRKEVKMNAPIMALRERRHWGNRKLGRHGVVVDHIGRESWRERQAVNTYYRQVSSRPQIASQLPCLCSPTEMTQNFR